MDGLQTLEAVRSEYPEIGVIMLCSRTVRGARNTIRCLNAGALDFIPKPDIELDGDPIEYVKKKLVARIREIAAARAHIRLISEPAHRVQDSPIASDVPRVLGIGVSTGGPAALRTIFENLPEIEGSILIAQHMPPIFTAQLAESLDNVSRMDVMEATDGMRLRSAFYVAPGGRQMTLQSDVNGYYLAVSDDEPELNCRPSVNILFRSIARVAGKNAAALIMTGMGSDGYSGMRELRAAGAYLMAQSQESCLVYGMPAQPVTEGLVDEIIPLDLIARRVGELFSPSPAA